MQFFKLGEGGLLWFHLSLMVMYNINNYLSHIEFLVDIAIEEGYYTNKIKLNLNSNWVALVSLLLCFILFGYWKLWLIIVTWSRLCWWCDSVFNFDKFLSHCLYLFTRFTTFTCNIKCAKVLCLSKDPMLQFHRMRLTNWYYYDQRRGGIIINGLLNNN